MNSVVSASRRPMLPRIGDKQIGKARPFLAGARPYSAFGQTVILRPGDSSKMIITRSPLRISLGGGGTDLPSYFRKHSGFLIAAAIDKFVYITVHQTFVPDRFK